jgi:cell shape-determining protein MreD
VITTKNILIVLAIGSIWGVAEVFAYDPLSSLGVGEASFWLAALAILLLSIGRGIWNKIGSSAVIGLVAAAFKFAGPSTNGCHLLGIAALGLFFDLFASSLLAQGRSHWWRHALVGLLTAYCARILFVAYSVYVGQSEYWIEGRPQMAIDHIVRGGSLVALVALFLAPLGFKFGKKAAEVLSGSPADDPLAANNR